MKTKRSKSGSNQAEKMVSIRIRKSTKEKAERQLESANNKSRGRAVKLDALISLAVGLVQDEHVKQLQDESLLL